MRRDAIEHNQAQLVADLNSNAKTRAPGFMSDGRRVNARVLPAGIRDNAILPGFLGTTESARAERTPGDVATSSQQPVQAVTDQSAFGEHHGAHFIESSEYQEFGTPVKISRDRDYAI